MGLRLATEKDCAFFRFWHDQQVLDGVDCQGDLFVAIEHFTLFHQASAYDRAYEIETLTSSALIVRTNAAYIVCANLTGTDWQNLLAQISPTRSPTAAPEFGRI